MGFGECIQLRKEGAREAFANQVIYTLKLFAGLYITKPFIPGNQGWSNSELEIPFL